MSSTGTAGDIDPSPFQNEEAAYRFVEQCVWPEGPVCPRCGGTQRVRPLRGRSVRIGAYKCYACRKPFTVKIGTILESSNLPMRKWLQAIFLASRDGERLDANSLHHALDVAPRTASYVLQRVQGILPAADPPVRRLRADGAAE